MRGGKTVPEIRAPGIRSNSAEAAVTVPICSSDNWWMRLPWRPVGGKNQGRCT